MSGSITDWIAGLKTGDAAAAEGLWRIYFGRLTTLARSRLSSIPRIVADEEDVALSAFKSLCLGAERGRFPLLQDRDSLWPLLVVLTARKSQDLVKHVRRQKRGAGCGFDSVEMNDLLGSEPTPEFAVSAAESCERMLTRLSPPLRRIAEFKLQGYTNQEIAGREHCGLRTIERRLDLIRRSWDALDGNV